MLGVESSFPRLPYEYKKTFPPRRLFFDLLSGLRGGSGFAGGTVGPLDFTIHYEPARTFLFFWLSGTRRSSVRRLGLGARNCILQCLDIFGWQPVDRLYDPRTDRYGRHRLRKRLVCGCRKRRGLPQPGIFWTFNDWNELDRLACSSRTPGGGLWKREVCCGGRFRSSLYGGYTIQWHEQSASHNGLVEGDHLWGRKICCSG